MRLLHTSDWHLGRSFHKEGMLRHQERWVDHLLEVVETEGVDVVLVSGDVYDRALPTVDAVAVAESAFERLAASRARVVVTSGNHDSARRLGFGSRLIDTAGVHLRTDPVGVGTPVLVHDAHGPVAFYGLPFLEPESVREAWGLARRSHQCALDEAMTRVRADLARRDGVRSVVLAHAFVAGATPSDSERDISVGGVDRVAVGTFEGVDYAALGHLHRPHRLTDRIRYSGSPLAYSFSEAEQRKGSWLVDLAADGAVTAGFVEAPVPRPLARIEGTLERLLVDPALEEHRGSWVQATLTDEARPLRAHDRLLRRFPHLLALAFTTSAADLLRPARRTPVSGRSTHGLTLEFVRDLRGSDATPAESRLLDDAVVACCGGDDKGGA